jgi:hypothetical protein
VGVQALHLSRRDRNRADRVPVAPPRTRRGEDDPVLIHKLLTGPKGRILILFSHNRKSETQFGFRFPNLFFSPSVLSLRPSRMRRFHCLAALPRLDADQQPLVEAIHCIDVTLGARVVRHHHDCFLELAIHIDQQAEDFLG